MDRDQPFAVVLKHPNGQLRELDCNTAKIVRVNTYSVESYSHMWRGDKRRFSTNIRELPAEALPVVREYLNKRRASHRKWALRAIDARSKVAEPGDEPVVLRIEGPYQTTMLGLNGAVGACVVVKSLLDPHDADHHDQMVLAEGLPKQAWDEIRHRTRTMDRVDTNRQGLD